MMNQEKETSLQAGAGWQDEMGSCHETGERMRFREKNQTKKKCERGVEEGRKNRGKKEMRKNKLAGGMRKKRGRQVSSGFCTTEGNNLRGGNS